MLVDMNIIFIIFKDKYPFFTKEKSILDHLETFLLLQTLSIHQ